MGKKRVIQKGADTSKDDSSGKATGAKARAKQTFEKGRVYIRASYNNTMITLTDDKGNVLATSSAGKLGFKGPKKATPYAATQVMESLRSSFARFGLQEVQVFVRGIGSGREAAIRAIPAQGLGISALRDITPVPHNGTRPRKARRV